MAQTPQEKIDQIKKQFEELNKANEVKMTSSFSPDPAWRTQPLYWQWTIRSLTPAEKRRLRWNNAKDAGKWVVSSLYGAASFIPEMAARIGAAWIDQFAWTDTQDKVDNFFWYVPNKLRDSSNSTYHFDKWQEYTDDALIAASLLTAWMSWPAAANPLRAKSNLRSLAKNPAKYDPIQAWQIVRAAETAWVDSVKVWNVKLTPRQVNSKFRLNWDADEAALTNKFYSSYDWAPAYQQKLYSQYNNAANGKNMSTFQDIPSQRFNTYNSQDAFRWYWYDRPKRQLPETELNNLYTPLTEERMAEMRKYLDDYDRIVNGRYISADEAEMLASDQAAFDDMASKAWFKNFSDAEKFFEKTYAWEYFNSPEQMVDYINTTRRPYVNKAEELYWRRYADDPEIMKFSNWSLPDAANKFFWRSNNQSKLPTKNTSRARANNLKKRNMSASERARRAAADERAKDSANEQYAALDMDADMARNDVKNMTLEEMYELWKAIQNW